jgi:hypothetical protein
MNFSLLETKEKRNAPIPGTGLVFYRYITPSLSSRLFPHECCHYSLFSLTHSQSLIPNDGNKYTHSLA